MTRAFNFQLPSLALVSFILPDNNHFVFKFINKTPL